MRRLRFRKGGDAVAPAYITIAYPEEAADDEVPHTETTSDTFTILCKFPLGRA